ncbi:hypothetical protein N9Y60_01240 [Crocinitomicaceae bacterium]|nr:hypothetical protein [Crocinitomicaceae bacterium]MDB3906426.1 hypothetical protein [Crocinitomicaceae bacterium]
MNLYLYPLIPGIIVGFVNWLYWRRRGYTSTAQLVLGILLFYAVFFAIYRYFVN